jgi:hypothetical protein
MYLIVRRKALGIATLKKVCDGLLIFYHFIFISLLIVCFYALPIATGFC